MTGSLYGAGWPTTSFAPPLQQQVLQLLHIVPQQLQNLQQLAHYQQQQLQQIQQALYIAAQQLQQFQQPWAGQLPFAGLSQFGQQIFPAQPSHVM